MMGKVQYLLMIVHKNKEGQVDRGLLAFIALSVVFDNDDKIISLTLLFFMTIKKN